MDLSFKYLGHHLDFGIHFGGTFLYMSPTSSLVCHQKYEQAISEDTKFQACNLHLKLHWKLWQPA
jgi:hypothetical protein